MANQNKIGLFLDDDGRGLERGRYLAKEKNSPFALSLYDDPTINWVHVKNYQEFLKHIRHNGLPHIISFDNDLGEEKEGFDCANFLCELCISTKNKVPLFIVHSQNNIANKRIYDKLNDTIKYEKTYLRK